MIFQLQHSQKDMEDARSKGLDVDELAYQNVSDRIKISENARMVQLSNLPTLTVPEIFTTVLALARKVIRSLSCSKW